VHDPARVFLHGVTLLGVALVAATVRAEARVGLAFGPGIPATNFFTVDGLRFCAVNARGIQGENCMI
jgi:hypothetical protein